MGYGQGQKFPRERPWWHHAPSLSYSDTQTQSYSDSLKVSSLRYAAPLLPRPAPHPGSIALAVSSVTMPPWDPWPDDTSLKYIHIFISQKNVCFPLRTCPREGPRLPPCSPPARASPAAPRRPRHTEIENDASKVGQKNSDLIYIYAVDCGMGYYPPLQASPAARAREGWGQRALHPPPSNQNSFWFIPRRRGEPRRSSIRGPTARRRRIGGEG